MGNNSMSVYRIRRPKIHFCPSRGWINDPNGLIKIDDKYHLFYQYHPYDVDYGPMHWGHAWSRDLIEWNERPIALYPGQGKEIFSGCAVATKGDGEGTLPRGSVAAVFTKNTRRRNGETEQTQNLATSVDSGETWEEFQGNPVLVADTPEKGRDFRDPKVIEHNDGHVMVLAVNDHVEFYRSVDLIHWEYLSSFSWPSLHGVWECPDLFLLRGREGESSRWILSISLSRSAQGELGRCVYFVGEFDGTEFAPIQEPVLWDEGPDFFAVATWDEERPQYHVAIAWMANWLYAKDMPVFEGDARGAMTIPRRLSFDGKNGDGIIKIKQEPAITTGRELFASNDRTDANSKDNAIEAKGIELPCLLEIRHEPADGCMGKEDRMVLEIDYGLGQVLSIVGKKGNQSLEIDRSAAVKTQFNDKFPGRVDVELDDREDGNPLKILLDQCSVEIFCDAGTTACTLLVFPESREGKIDMRLTSEGDRAGTRVAAYRILGARGD